MRYEYDAEYYDGNCPACHNEGKRVALRPYRENYGTDADGNRGRLIEYGECPGCDWNTTMAVPEMNDGEAV